MVPNDDFDWKKELSPPPLQGKGFDDKLRRRIEERLDRKEQRRRKRFWLFPALGFCSFLIVAAGMWLAVPYFCLSREGGPFESVQASGASGPVDQDTAGVNESLPVKTGLLIGLRQDHGADRGPDSDSYSTYRTLMLAPVDGQVRVTAEGNGILVPYGQKFWKIDALTLQTETDRIDYLSAHPADKPAEHVQYEDDPEERVFFSEKLLFAGNQYVSVTQKEAVRRGDSWAEHNRAWVKKLNQLKGDLPADGSEMRAEDEHVALQEVYGEGAGAILAALVKPHGAEGGIPSSLNGDSWAIMRKPGHWAAQAAATYSGAGKRYEGFTLYDYPTALPEMVTSHDKVCCTWGQVRSMQPDAKDLLSSPLDDMMVILTGKELIVYSTADHGQSGPLLRVQLKPGEQLVSAQWATGGYVAQWVEKTRKYLQPELQIEEGR